ncbi:MAG: ABC-type sugar transport system, ATPase component [Microbacterium sp.]|nr:ABC-type sugar transport system, ATPase component [Microbacterium sp.]
MSISDDNLHATGEANPGIQPLRDEDTSIEPDATADPAQAEWDATLAADAGEVAHPATATGADPAEIPSDEDEIPAEDIHPDSTLPETQGIDPLESELGEDGQGDLAPEDL